MSFLGVPLGNQGTGTVVKDGCGKIFYDSSIHSALRNALFLRTTTLGCVHPGPGYQSYIYTYKILHDSRTSG